MNRPDSIDYRQPDALAHACDRLDESGCCVVTDVLNAADLAAVRESLYRQAETEQQANVKLRNFAHLDTANQWVNMLLNKGLVFHDLVRHELALNLARHLLGDNFLLSCCDAQIKHPGATAMFVNTCGGDQNPLPRRSRSRSPWTSRRP